jgi:nitrite reductase/ring-hydroxylating ferredoxin subunit
VSRSRPGLFARRDGAGRHAPDVRLRAAEQLEHARALDGAAAALTDLLRRVLPRGSRADALHGVPFGQPAHPALTGLPLGFWTSAAVLDFVPGSERAARTLIALGLATAVPATATGWADWSALHREQQRVGLVHAASGACAATLFTASLLARSSGRAAAGRVLAVGGLAAATAGGYLGRHLVFPLGAGTSHAEPVTHLATLGWHDLCQVTELPEGRPVRRRLGYLALAVIREGAGVSALADQCAHLGGPLHQGRLEAASGRSCIVCPWHGSAFRVADGSVVHGPATARQPAFEVRVSESGIVQVRPRRPRPGPG